MESQETPTKPRRILIFSLVYYPRFIGGAEVAVKEITDRISPDEMSFDMITMRKHASPFERIGNVDVHRVGMPWIGKNVKSSRIFPLSKLLFIIRAYRMAVKLHRKEPYDAVWPIMASYAGLAATLFKKKFPEVPMVLTIQEGDNFERREGIFKSAFRKIFKSADRIQVISNFLAEWSRKMGATCPIEVVPNGVDFDQFSRQIGASERGETRAEFGVKDTDILLVTASRLVHKNAIDDIISALRFLHKSRKLLILGTGPLESGLRDQAEKSRVRDRVIFRGFVPHAELPRYLQASDIFVRPSRTEGLGNSFLEAMAAGIPVIATPVGGIPDFLREGETGLFCDVGHPESIALRVEKLAKDGESRDHIIRKARDMVRSNYDWQGISRKMKAILAS